MHTMLLKVLTVMCFAMPQDASAPAVPSRTELEARFREQLTGATFVGSWQMTDAEGLKGKAPLQASREERYTILSAEKLDGEHWWIRARIQFGEADATLPVRVRVVWAGDTPVITVDDFSFPGMGAYSARVVVYRGFYAGTWFGKTYGGVMSGQIFHDLPPASQPAPVAPVEAPGGKAPGMSDN